MLDDRSDIGMIRMLKTSLFRVARGIRSLLASASLLTSPSFVCEPVRADILDLWIQVYASRREISDQPRKLGERRVYLCICTNTYTLERGVHARSFTIVNV
jgi:hypothetical protein